jgi:hypothetical protein
VRGGASSRPLIMKRDTMADGVVQGKYRVGATGGGALGCGQRTYLDLVGAWRVGNEVPSYRSKLSPSLNPIRNAVSLCDDRTRTLPGHNHRRRLPFASVRGSSERHGVVETEEGCLQCWDAYAGQGSPP